MIIYDSSGDPSIIVDFYYALCLIREKKKSLSSKCFTDASCVSLLSLWKVITGALHVVKSKTGQEVCNFEITAQVIIVAIACLKYEMCIIFLG